MILTWLFMEHLILAFPSIHDFRWHHFFFFFFNELRSTILLFDVLGLWSAFFFWIWLKHFSFFRTLKNAHSILSFLPGPGHDLTWFFFRWATVHISFLLPQKISGHGVLLFWLGFYFGVGVFCAVEVFLQASFQNIFFHHTPHISGSWGHGHLFRGRQLSRDFFFLGRRDFPWEEKSSLRAHIFIVDFTELFSSIRALYTHISIFMIMAYSIKTLHPW